MMTTAARAPARPRRRAQWVAGALIAVDLLGALFMIVLPHTTLAEKTLVLAAAAVGVAAALAFARSVDTRSLGARAVWLARGLGLVGAAMALWFPAILFAELRGESGAYRALPRVLREIEFTALTLPFAVIPAVVALRLPVAGGVLFVVMAALQYVQAAYDPTGSFPGRAVGASIVISTLPPLAIGLALIAGGRAVRRAEPEPTFAAWLGSLRPRDGTRT